MDNIIDIRAILEYLPQRYPFLLVDKVLECKIEESLVAIKNVSVNEPFFQGHFPGLPIMPGVLIIEALAQASGILAIKTALSRGLSARGIYYFAAIDNARFKRPVLPGDQMRMEVELIKDKSDIWKFKTTAMVDGHVACVADLTSARRDT